MPKLRVYLEDEMKVDDEDISIVKGFNNNYN